MKLSSVTSVVAVVTLLGLPVVASSQSATDGPIAVPERLPASIPIFPLPEVMLFPGVSRPLHIFEPRYRAMVADALKGDRIIGMVLLESGHEAEYEGRPPVYPVGCAGIITDVQELPDGRFNLVLRGFAKFRVISEDGTRPYRLARVEPASESLTDDQRAALREERQRLEKLLGPSLASAPIFPPGMPDEGFVNTLAQHLELGAVERQSLLEQPGPLARARALVDLLDLLMPAQR